MAYKKKKKKKKKKQEKNVNNNAPLTLTFEKEKIKAKWRTKGTYVMKAFIIFNVYLEEEEEFKQVNVQQTAL